jgi:hypothetical protein
MLTVFAALACGSRAYADNLVLGGNYVPVSINLDGADNTSVGGGPVSPSSLNGRTLPYVYCVDLFHDVSVPGTYNALVTNTGVANGNYIHNANEIAFLLKTYGAGATTRDQQAALQAAIWSVEYDGTGASPFNHVVTLASGETPGAMAYYATYMTSIGSASVSNFLWLTPGGASDFGIQGLITANTPEPSTLAIAGLSALGLAYSLRRKARRA